MRTRCYTGKPARCIRTPYAQEWEKDPSRIKPFPQQAMISTQNGVMSYAADHADPERVFMPAGQGSGLIKAIKPAAEVFADLVREAEESILRLNSLLSRPTGAAPGATLR